MQLSGITPIDGPSFERVRAFLESRTGVHLGPSKTALVVARLNKRLRELGYSDYVAYLRVLDEKGHPEQDEIVDRLLTNETSLFREPWQFEYLENSIVPFWAARRDRNVRVWSAACSSGEEPASVAAILARGLPRAAGYNVDILATDLSRRALSKARAFRFPANAATTTRWSEELRPMDADHVTITQEARSLIRFEQKNLLDSSPQGHFDLILCRNVLIYFSAANKRAVVHALWRALRPGGYLFLGHAEGMLGLTEAKRAVKPAIYRKDDVA